VPTTQSKQNDKAVVSAYLPYSQSVQLVEPGEAKLLLCLPVAQSAQKDSPAKLL